MERVPVARADVVHVALPVAIAWDPQPAIVRPPSLNATVPVGTGEPESVAVKVTDWPAFEGLRPEPSVTAVLPLTLNVTDAESAPKPPSIVCRAVIVWLPSEEIADVQLQ